MPGRHSAHKLIFHIKLRHVDYLSTDFSLKFEASDQFFFRAYFSKQKRELVAQNIKAESNKRL